MNTGGSPFRALNHEARPAGGCSCRTAPRSTALVYPVEHARHRRRPAGCRSPERPARPRCRARTPGDGQSVSFEGVVGDNSVAARPQRARLLAALELPSPVVSRTNPSDAGRLHDSAGEHAASWWTKAAAWHPLGDHVPNPEARLIASGSMYAAALRLGIGSRLLHHRRFPGRGPLRS